jgi:hypothetical protein
MHVRNIEKISEGLYELESLACPSCTLTVKVRVSGESVYLMHQGANISRVLENETLDVMERFITGICGDCWESFWAPHKGGK